MGTMTSRETFLLRIMGLTALTTVLLLGIQAFLDETVALDQKFATIQKEASQIQTKLIQASSQPQPQETGDTSSLLWESGNIPEPLVLARSIRPVLDGQRLLIREFQVVPIDYGFTLKYSLEGTASSFVQALLSVRESDEKLIVRRFSARLQEHGIYRFEWEVGYSSIP